MAGERDLRVGALIASAGRLPLCVCAGGMTGALLLGGGTRVGLLSDAVLQLFFVPLLALALWRLPDVVLGRHAKLGLLFCAGLTAVPLLQLVPLPPNVWTRLPGRADVALSFAESGLGTPWMPISLAPRATWLALLSLVVPSAIFVATLQLSWRHRRLASLVVLAVGLGGVMLGFLQVAQGPDSALRFHAIVNPSEAVGFFANRNHFAASVYCLLLTMMAWVVTDARDVEQRLYRRRHLATRNVIPIAAAFAGLVMLITAETLARSRAGLGLTMLALLGAFALLYPERPNGGRNPGRRILIAAMFIAVALAAQFGLYRVLERFGSDPLADARIRFARNTIAAAVAHLPVGSGVGTFIPVYAKYEPPSDALADTFVNRAHNDVLEVLLESGIPGLLLIGALVAWLVVRGIEVWRPSLPIAQSGDAAPGGVGDTDRALTRAAALMIALLLLHSLVDYPLRTAAMMAIFAFAAALLVPPPPGAEDDHDRALSRRRSTPAVRSEPDPSRPVARRSRTRSAQPASSPPLVNSLSVGQDRIPPAMSTHDWPEAWSVPVKSPRGARPPRDDTSEN